MKNKPWKDNNTLYKLTESRSSIEKIIDSCTLNYFGEYPEYGFYSNREAEKVCYFLDMNGVNYEFSNNSDSFGEYPCIKILSDKRNTRKRIILDNDED